MQNIKSCFKRIYKTKIKQSLTVKSYRLGFKSWYLKLTGICKNSLKLKPVVVYLNSTIFMYEFLDVHLLTLEGLDFWAIVCRFHCVEGGNPHSQRNWEFSAPPLCTCVSHTPAHSPYPVTNNRIHSTHKTSICSYRIQTVVGFTTIKEKRIISRPCDFMEQFYIHCKENNW